MAKASRMRASTPSIPDTFRKVSCWPANDASGRSSAVADDLTANVANMDAPGVNGLRLVAVANRRRLERTLRIMLDEGVVAEAQDIDLCLILGAGWPFWLGGITPYLDREGVSQRVNGKPFLAPGVASVPA